MKNICIGHSLACLLLFFLGFGLVELTDTIFGTWAMVCAGTGLTVGILGVDKGKNGNMLMSISCMIQLGTSAMFLLYAWAMVKDSYFTIQASQF